MNQCGEHTTAGFARSTVRLCAARFGGTAFAAERLAGLPGRSSPQASEVWRPQRDQIPSGDGRRHRASGVTAVTVNVNAASAANGTSIVSPSTEYERTTPKQITTIITAMGSGSPMMLKVHVTPGITRKDQAADRTAFKKRPPENSRPRPQCGQRLRCARHGTVALARVLTSDNTLVREGKGVWDETGAGNMAPWTCRHGRWCLGHVCDVSRLY